jgi:hypothetical protein
MALYSNNLQPQLLLSVPISVLLRLQIKEIPVNKIPNEKILSAKQGKNGTCYQ